MITRTFLRMTHLVDVYKKDTVVDEFGQRVASYTLLVKDQPCYAVPTGATSIIRMQPTIEQIDYFTISLPHDAPVTYDTILKNLVSKTTRESAYPYPLQVIKWAKYPSYTGKPSYLEITGKTWIENVEGY